MRCWLVLVLALSVGLGAVGVAIALNRFPQMNLDLEQINDETGWLETIAAGQSSQANPTPSNGAAYTVTVLPLVADANGSEAYAINDVGRVAGRVYTVGPDSWSIAVVWNESVPEPLPSLFDGGSSGATAIDNHGRVAGWAETAAGEHHAVLWQDGAIHDLGTLGGAESEAADMDDDGRVIGWAETATGIRRAFVWEGGAMRDLGTLGGEESEATAITTSGHVVGWAESASSIRRAFRWQTGTMEALPSSPGYGASVAVDINDAGQVVGEFSPGPTAFLWDGCDITLLFGSDRAPRTRAIAITDQGQILAANDAVPTVLESGRAAVLPRPTDAWFMDFAEPSDLNERGQAVGSLIRASGGNRAVIWDPLANEASGQ